MPDSIRQLWSKKELVVSGNTTQVVDLIPLSRLSRLEYIVEMRDVTSEKAKGFKFSVQKVESGLDDVLYAKTGNPINIEISANVNGSECEIEFTNNEIFDLALSFTRLKL